MKFNIKLNILLIFTFENTIQKAHLNIIVYVLLMEDISSKFSFLLWKAAVVVLLYKAKENLHSYFLRFSQETCLIFPLVSL